MVEHLTQQRTRFYGFLVLGNLLKCQVVNETNSPFWDRKSEQASQSLLIK